jgi:hypothetical protein
MQILNQFLYLIMLMRHGGDCDTSDDSVVPRYHMSHNDKADIFVPIPFLSILIVFDT